MSFLKSLVSGVSGALGSAKALAADAYLDSARRDDAELGAYLMVSIAHADGSFGANEAQIIVKATQSIFRNFSQSEIAAFVREAIEAHSVMPDLGYAVTEDKLRDFNDDAGSLRKVLIATVGVAKMGGMEPAERQLIERFLRARNDIRAADIGL